MVESVGESLPSIISTTIAMIVLSIITLGVARKSGVGDIQRAVSEENDRLVAKQSERIRLLEEEVNELKILNAQKDATILVLTARIDDLERLFSDRELRKLDREK